MTANQILKLKTIPEMTMQEIDIVMERAKDANFENMIGVKNHTDFKKRAMGLWALGIFKDNKNSFIIRNKIKEQYKMEMNYYIQNKTLPEPSDREKKVNQLIEDLDTELFWRKAWNILSIDI